MSWIDMMDKLPELEWQRLLALERGQTSDRVEDIEADHMRALVRDAEQTAWEAMEELQKLRKDDER